MEEKLLAFFNFDELNSFLNGILNREHIGIEDLLQELITGDFSSFTDLLGKYVHEVFFGNLEQCRELFLGIMLFFFGWVGFWWLGGFWVGGLGLGGRQGIGRWVGYRKGREE